MNTVALCQQVIIYPDGLTFDAEKKETCHTLVECLCERSRQGQLLSNTSLVLLSGIHWFHSSQHCIISNIRMLSVTGSEGTKVQCVGTTNLNIMFHNVTDVSLSNIEFSQCGSAIPITNSTKVKHGQQAVLYFSNSNFIQLQKVNVSNYRGFAMLFINIFSGLLVDQVEINLTNCCHVKDNISCSCSGIVMYYEQNKGAESNLTIDILVKNSKFHNIMNTYHPPSRIPFCRIYDTESEHHPLVTSAGLSLILAPIVTFVNKIGIHKCQFFYNYGIVGAGILILAFQNPDNLNNTQISMSSNYFKKNLLFDLVNPCIGSAIHLSFLAYTNKVKSYFKILPQIGVNLINNTITGNKNRSSIFIQAFGPLKVNANITGLICKDNVVAENGMCLTAKMQQSLTIDKQSSLFTIHLNNIKAINNNFWKQKYGTFVTEPIYERDRKPSLLMFINIHMAIITGSVNDPSLFDRNSVPVLVSLQSRIRLEGWITFNDHLTSTVLYLTDTSHLILSAFSHISFTGTHRSKLGQDLIHVTNSPDSTQESPCALQLDFTECDIHKINSSFNIQLYKHSTFHLVPAYNCLQTNKPLCNISMETVYRTVLKQAVIRSNSIGVYYFDTNGHIKGGLVQNFIQSIHPGSNVTLCIALLDYAKNVVPGSMLITLNSKISQHQHEGLVFSNGESSLVKASHNYTNCSKYTFKIYSQHPNITSGRMQFSEIGRQPTLAIDLTILKCPFGFTLIYGKCRCNEFIQFVQRRHREADFNCFIVEIDGTKFLSRIMLKTNSWLGKGNKATIQAANKFELHDNNDSMMLYSGIYPLGFCNFSKNYVDLSVEDSLCIGNRTGQVCSDCKKGFSMIFGSTKCRVCSNIWLWTVVMYALTGVVLVAFLLLLHLTIDHGPVASIILYCNIAMFGLSYLKGINSHFIGHESILISLVNFNIGFPICFYNGMTNTMKTALQFVFPLYVWIMILLIIVISRYSTAFSNWTVNRSVQVLVTILHLSYVKVLVTIIDVFTPLKVFVENINSHNIIVTYLWYANPSLPYGRTKEHIILMAVATVFLCAFVLPYLLLSLFVPLCWRWRLVIKFRPVFETIYGPYKHKYAYWFGVRLLVITLFTVISASMQGINMYNELLLFQVILIVLLVFQTYIRPYKSGLTNIFDAYVLTNITLLYLFGILAALQGKIDLMNTSTVVSSGFITILLLIIAVLVYHTVKYIRPVNKCVLSRIVILIKGSGRALKLYERLLANDIHASEEYQPLTDNSNTILREPLMQYMN